MYMCIASFPICIQEFSDLDIDYFDTFPYFVRKPTCTLQWDFRKDIETPEAGTNMVFFYSRCFGILGTFFVIHIPISNTCCYIPYTHDDYTVLVFNPSSYGPFFLCHLMASGHIEPGS